METLVIPYSTTMLAYPVSTIYVYTLMLLNKNKNYKNNAKKHYLITLSDSAAECFLKTKLALEHR